MVRCFAKAAGTRGRGGEQATPPPVSPAAERGHPMPERGFCRGGRRRGPRGGRTGANPGWSGSL